MILVCYIPSFRVANAARELFTKPRSFRDRYFCSSLRNTSSSSSSSYGSKSGTGVGAGVGWSSCGVVGVGWSLMLHLLDAAIYGRVELCVTTWATYSNTVRDTRMRRAGDVPRQAASVCVLAVFDVVTAESSG